jgi:hypothetical protein
LRAFFLLGTLALSSIFQQQETSMKPSVSSLRRRLLATGLALSAVGLSTPLLAQSFPARPLRIVVPFAAGGAGDLTARIVAAELSI